MASEFVKLYNTFRLSERQVRENIYRVLDLVDDRIQNGSFVGHIDNCYITDTHLLILVYDEKNDFVYQWNIPIEYFDMTDDEILADLKEQQDEETKRIDSWSSEHHYEYKGK